MNPGQGLRFFFVPNIVTTAFYGIKFEEFFFQEELRKQQRKVARREKKQRTGTVDDGEIDPNLAATMGFAGFGSSKKCYY